MGDHRSIGSLLRRARERSGLTLSAAAERAGVSKGYLSHLERDERSPSIRVLARLARALGFDLRMRFEEVETVTLDGSEEESDG